jgi:hypothetical protein
MPQETTENHRIISPVSNMPDMMVEMKIVPAEMKIPVQLQEWMNSSDCTQM